ncbi:hypothetical protein MCOR16_009691 [Pyricularia oryzae]|nr:hypothetical protein MCOR16_009691 [Pyricularia oryzae]
MTWHLGFLVLSLRQVAASAKVKPPKVPKTYLMLGVQAVMTERPKDACCQIAGGSASQALWPCACGRSHLSLVKMHMESLAHYATEISRTSCESIEEPSTLHPGWTPTGWQTTLMSMTYLLLIVAVNLWAFRVVPWVELLAGIVNVVLFLVFLILVWVLAPQNSLDTFLTKSSVGGWGDFVSFNIDSLGTIYLFIAVESIVHLGEEARNPKRAVPTGMFWGYVVNAVMGFMIAMLDFNDCAAIASAPSLRRRHWRCKSATSSRSLV